MPDPVLLLILDGWGLAPAGPGNAPSLAATPYLDDLLNSWPRTSLACSGRAVGLPEGFMGNSEVGHMNIGAGRVIYQDMTRIDMAVEDGSLAENEVLADLFAKVRDSGGRLHFMGLLSDGGVHSHIRHLLALVDAAKAAGVGKVLIHAFLDGRDTPPSSGAGYLEQLQEFLGQGPEAKGMIASITGRYWAMDRDKRWERVQRAYAALVNGGGKTAHDPVAAVRDSYAKDIGDEFVEPSLVVDADGEPIGRIQDGDGVFFFNFRADRARELTRALADDGFGEFPRPQRPKLAGFATMTQYDGDFPLPAAFPPQHIEHTLGQTVSEAGLAQLRIAETEKYAHVTYFLNCGREEPFPGEDRVLVPSPREVATYDLKPEMSAREVTDKLIAALDSHALCVCNLANLDMVGHTGMLDAAIRASEVVDECVGRILQAAKECGARVLVTADHGNSEVMLAENGPHTAHSTNPVPFVYVDPTHSVAELAPEGKLADIAPTVLALLGLDVPEAMTGTNLIR